MPSMIQNLLRSGNLTPTIFAMIFQGLISGGSLAVADDLEKQTLEVISNANNVLDKDMDDTSVVNRRSSYLNINKGLCKYYSIASKLNPQILNEIKDISGQLAKPNNPNLSKLTTRRDQLTGLTLELQSLLDTFKKFESQYFNKGDFDNNCNKQSGKSMLDD